jgi:hypothetical protein
VVVCHGGTGTTLGALAAGPEDRHGAKRIAAELVAIPRLDTILQPLLDRRR